MREAASEDEPAEEEAEGAVEEEDAAGEDAEVETEEPAAPAGELPDDVDGIITYCRRVDGKLAGSRQASRLRRY